MIYIRNRRIKMSIALALALLTIAYVCFVAPPFQARIDALRMENKLLIRDIEAIDEMQSDTSKLRGDIAEVEKALATFRAGMSINAETVMDDITKKAANAGMTSLMFAAAIARDRKEGEPTEDGAYLASMEFSVSADGDYASGVRFMQSLEESETGAYDVVGFAYDGRTDADAEDEAHRWIMRLVLYYYCTAD
jgi:hypothetical protein